MMVYSDQRTIFIGASHSSVQGCVSLRHKGFESRIRSSSKIPIPFTTVRLCPETFAMALLQEKRLTNQSSQRLKPTSKTR